MTKWNEDNFKEWINLRGLYREAKKQKDYEKVIFYCEEIIKLDKKSKFIGIMTPLFNKEIATSFLKLKNVAKAIEFYELAVSRLIKYREKESLNDSSDWIKDVENITDKIHKLKKTTFKNTQKTKVDI